MFKTVPIYFCVLFVNTHVKLSKAPLFQCFGTKFYDRRLTIPRNFTFISIPQKFPFYVEIFIKYGKFDRSGSIESRACQSMRSLNKLQYLYANRNNCNMFLRIYTNVRIISASVQTTKLLTSEIT